MTNDLLSSFGENLSVAVIGASGGIGRALINYFAEHEKIETIYAMSRSAQGHTHDKVVSQLLDSTNEESIQAAVDSIPKDTKLDIVIVTTGLLHSDTIAPEKSLRNLNADQMAEVFLVNTIGPSLIAKHFIPRLSRGQKSVFACLSARVGSISDNRLGGWYAYRSSKAALNMILKNAAIETARRNKQACVIGLHPGTVDTGLSKPFQKNVSEDKLFTPQYSAECLLKVIDDVTSENSGRVFAWDGSVVPE